MNNWSNHTNVIFIDFYTFTRSRRYYFIAFVFTLVCFILSVLKLLPQVTTPFTNCITLAAAIRFFQLSQFEEKGELVPTQTWSQWADEEMNSIE